MKGGSNTTGILLQITLVWHMSTTKKCSNISLSLSPSRCHSSAIVGHPRNAAHFPSDKVSCTSKRIQKAERNGLDGPRINKRDSQMARQDTDRQKTGQLRKGHPENLPTNPLPQRDKNLVRIEVPLAIFKLPLWVRHSSLRPARQPQMGMCQSEGSPQTRGNYAVVSILEKGNYRVPSKSPTPAKSMAPPPPAFCCCCSP